MPSTQPQNTGFASDDNNGASAVYVVSQVSDEREALEASEAVRRFTSALFDGDVCIKTTFDPEIDNRMQVVTVAARGTIDELANKCDFWHRHLHETARNFTSLYALNIIPLDETE
jgi:hypothetical protein